jgi:hypothetical protein
VKQKHRRQKEDLTAMPQPHDVAKTHPSHKHHTIFFKGLFSIHVNLPSSSAVSAPAGIVGRRSVLRTKREHKAISRTVGLHSTPSLQAAAAKRTEQPSETKQSGSQSFAHALKSIHGGQRIHWLRSLSSTRARHTDWSLAANCGMGRGAGG